MIDPDFVPQAHVYHESGAPRPLLPIDYSPFKMIDLPPGIGRRPLLTQLAIVRLALEKAAIRYPSSPFGAIVAYEFEWRRSVSIFLNVKGEFSDNSELSSGRGYEGVSQTISKPTLGRDSWQREYVIGCHEGEFYSLLSDLNGEQANDQDLTFARRFYSFAAAQTAADEEGASIFEIIRGEAQEKLREIMIDLRLAEDRPFDGCYRLAERLWVGPSFRSTNANETDARINALAAAGVNCIVSVIDPKDTFEIEQLTELSANSGAFAAPHFEHSFFPVRSGEAPSKRQTKIILDVIDAAYFQGKIAYLHCAAGRGRAGCVAGCWMARHGIANGRAALDELVERRYTTAVLEPSPETDVQRHLIMNWKFGE